MADSPKQPKAAPKRKPSKRAPKKPHHLSDTPFQVVETAAAQGIKSVVVAVSGGKDSLAVLDLCSKYFDTIVGYFMYFVPGLQFKDRYLDCLERKYDFQILRLPHPGVIRLMRKSFYRHPTHRSGQQRVMTFRAVEDHVRKKTGIQWFATGEKCYDSIQRQAQIKKHGGIDSNRHRVYPVAYWTNRQVHSYLRRHRIALPPDYKLTEHINNAIGVPSRRSDMSLTPLDPNQLAIIRDTYPDDYGRIVKFFPLLETTIARHDFMAQQAKRRSDNGQENSQEDDLEAGGENVSG